MSEIVMRTERLDLVLEGPEAVMARIEAMPPEDRAEVSPVWLEKLRALTEPDPWMLGFNMIDRAIGLPVGSGGFKGPPDEKGIVELAYGIDPAYRRQGYATEAAIAMTQYALANEQVKLVCAHTKSGNGASERILEKCGFQFIGEVIDPEDGLVSRWERKK